MYNKYIKRPLDFVVSFILIIFLSPLLSLIAFLVYKKLGSPIIFKQQRVGKNERIFNMYKFRTMIDDYDENGNLLSDDARLTKFGKMLRSTSLDELPELFNILKGDLAIVGPRSLLVDYLPYYSDYERQRHLVRGGLTPPEVLYSNIMPTWEEQFKYEVDYANNVSFMLDMRILFATFKGVIIRNSANYGSYVREALNKERQKVNKSIK